MDKKIILIIIGLSILLTGCNLKPVDRLDYSAYASTLSNHCTQMSGNLTTHINSSNLLYCECVEGNLTTSLVLNYNTSEYFVDRYLDVRKKDKRLIAYESYR